MCKSLAKKVSETEPLKELSPEFVVIGSLIEGTVVGGIKDIDITCQLLSGFSDQYYFIADEMDPFELRVSSTCQEVHPARDFLENDVLKYDKLFYTFLDCLRISLISMEDEISDLTNGRLKIGQAQAYCEKCREVSAIPHCENCLFPVTHSKVGACLIFTSDTGDVLTVDVDLVLPIRKATKQENKADVLCLQRAVARSTE